MARLLQRAGLPSPVMRYVLELDSRRVEIDFAYPDRCLGIEVDGHGAHATRRQRAADNDRANALADAGWTLRRFTYEQVIFDERFVEASVRRAIATPPKRL